MLNPTSTDAVGAALLAAFRHNFQLYKSLADRALAQLSAAEWLHQPAPGSWCSWPKLSGARPFKA